MTTFLLVRHAEHDLLGKVIAGRMSGVALSARGLAQAGELVRRLPVDRIEAIYSSPQQRALETAAPVARHLSLNVAIDAAFDEIDFGEWTGRTFDQLHRDGERWRLWVERKSIARAPGGEAFVAVRDRAVSGMQRLQQEHPEQTVLVVSHGDVVKAVLATFLGMPLDHLERFEIAPASISIVATGPGWSQVKLVNATLD